MEFNQPTSNINNLIFQTPIISFSKINFNYNSQNDITNDKTKDSLNDIIMEQSSIINPLTFAKASLPTRENGIINYLNITKLNSSIKLETLEIENKTKEIKNNLIGNTQKINLINTNSLNLPIIYNIVSTIDLKCKLNLNGINKKVKNTSYQPKRFPAIIMNIKNPKSTALIFESGKLVCLGTKNEYDCKNACKIFAKNIKKLNYDVKFSSFKIHNIVSSCNVGFKIRLLNLKYENFNCTNYEPEIFPGLIFSFYQPKIIMLIFKSGKICIFASKTRNDIYDSYYKIFPILYKNRVRD